MYDVTYATYVRLKLNGVAYQSINKSTYIQIFSTLKDYEDEDEEDAQHKYKYRRI